MSPRIDSPCEMNVTDKYCHPLSMDSTHKQFASSKIETRYASAWIFRARTAFTGHPGTCSQ